MASKTYFKESPQSQTCYGVLLPDSHHFRVQLIQHEPLRLKDMLRFVEDNVGGVGKKRMFSQKPCQSCRKRHKRCHHSRAPDQNDVQFGHSPARNLMRGESSTAEAQQQHIIGKLIDPLQNNGSPLSTNGDGNSGQQGGSVFPEHAYLRFIGDLNPRASFISNHYRHSGGSDSSNLHETGVWQTQNSEETSVPECNLDATSAPTGVFEPPSIRRSGLISLQALSPFLRKECASVLPPDYEFGIMSSLYYTKFAVIFPVLHEEDFSGLNEMEVVALKQCICLTASLDPSQKPHLRLPHTEAILPPAEFRKCLTAAVKQSIDMGFVRDRMTLLQVYALMSFSSSDSNGSELSADFCVQAVNCSQTLGLHLGWPQESQARRSRRFYWCTRVLDRLNAAINGRPILMHDRDTDPQVRDSLGEQIPAFQLLIRISEVLERIIARYRPSPSQDDQVSEEVTFEDLVLNSEALSIANPLLASLELFYLAVMILRDRPSRHGNSHERTSESAIQFSHATNIISLVTEDFKKSIIFWPIVPYSVSLATSVAYQHMRNNRIPYKRNRAYALFHSSCDLLIDLSTSFSSAQTMATLAKSTLQEFERIAANRNRSNTLQPSSQRESLQNKSKVDSLSSKNDQLSTVDSESPCSLALLNDKSAVDFNHDHIVAAPFDPFLEECLDFAVGSKVFEDFNPEFDLDHIDAMFSANLNTGVPPSKLDFNSL